MKNQNVGNIIAKLLKRKEGREYSKKQSDAINALIGANVVYQVAQNFYLDKIATVYANSKEWESEKSGQILATGSIVAIGDFKTIMVDSMYSEQDLDCALCIFDEFSNALLLDHIDPKPALCVYLQNVRDGDGSPALRELAMNIAKPIEKAWCENTELVEKVDAFPFDLEFVPELLARAVVQHESLNLTENQWCELTAEVLRDQIGSRSPIYPIVALANTDIDAGALVKFDKDGGVSPAGMPEVGDTWDADDLNAALNAESEHSYRVTWEIDINAANPKDAALKAQGYQRDPNSTATVFNVATVNNGGTLRTVEIDTAEETDLCVASDKYLAFADGAQKSFKDDHDHRKHAVVIHAAQAVKAINALIDAIGEKFVHELTDLAENNYPLDLRAVQKDLLLIAEAWGD